VQIGCSERAIAAMMQFARGQVGKPFSSMGMFRSMVWPRATDMSSWYCAELVAACLKTGGLMSADSNPGAATPHSLYKLYKRQGAVMANPCTLRQQFGAMSARPLALAAPPAHAAHAARRPPPGTIAVPLQLHSIVGRPVASAHRRSDSPPHMQFKTLQQRGTCDARSTRAIELSLSSLNMDRRH
jgi:hypothetical protein